MRRVITAAFVVVLAVLLAACSGGETTETTTTETGAPVATSTAPATQTAAVTPDLLSPQPVVVPGEKLPTDADQVPSAVLSNVAAHKPMLIYYYDPSTTVSNDQRSEINAAMKDYTGLITLMSYDYTASLPSDDATAVPAMTDAGKAVLMAGTLRVNTTPYIIFSDAAGRITGRFAGYVDRDLIEREIMQATE